MPSVEAAFSTEIELVSVGTDMDTNADEGEGGGEDGNGGGPSAGPPAVRQDLPPQRAPEPQTPSLPLPPGTIPLSLPSQPLESPQQMPAPARVAPEVVFNPDAVYDPQTDTGSAETTESNASEEGYAWEGTGSGPSSATGAPGASGTGYPYARIPSGGAVGGTGLPGGGTSLGGSGSGSGSGRGGGGGRRSPGRPSASTEKRFIPYYKVDRPPKIVQNAALEYPAQAKRRNLEATVILEADIDETGRVEDVRVIKPAGFGFDEAAAKYVKESRFSPAYVGERSVAVLMRISVQFTLSD